MSNLQTENTSSDAMSSNFDQEVVVDKPFDLSDPELFEQIEAKPEEPGISDKLDDLIQFIKHHNLIHCEGCFYRYGAGFYHEWKSDNLRKYVSCKLTSDSYNKKRLDNIIDGLRTHASKEPPNYRTCLNINNGILDLETLKMNPHSPDFFFRYQIPIEYKADRKAPHFEAFLKSSIPDETERKILLEFIGYALSGDTQHHKALFLIGSGGNGKGVLVKVLQELFGNENACSVDISDLYNENNRFLLYGKRVNLCTEMSSRIIDKDFRTYKQLTSFESVNVKKLYRDPFRISPNCKMIFSTNENPIFPEVNEAAFRRFLPVLFPFTFTDDDPEHTKDVHLFSKLKPEMSGILNLALEGLKRLREQGKFSSSESTDHEMLSHRRRMNPVKEFMNERMQGSKGNHLGWNDFLQKLRSYCDEHSLDFPALSQIGKEVRKLYRTSGNTSRHQKKVHDVTWR